MKMTTFALMLALLAGCGGGGSDAGPQPSALPLVAAGDSITRRTGVDPIPAAYPDFIPGVVANLGRGGDTCTTQAPYKGGLHDGQPRGLAGRLGLAIDYRPRAALVLIGINDRNSYGVPEPQVIECIRSVWSALRLSGIEPIALTYPPMAEDTNTWPLPAGQARANGLGLNRAIRSAARTDAVVLIELENLTPYSTVDGAHPDERSAQLMAATVRNSLKG
jgi:lysophospholipase L1-like esterase